MKYRLLAIMLIVLLLFSCGCNKAPGLDVNDVLDPYVTWEQDETEAEYQPGPHDCPPRIEKDLWVWGDDAIINCAHTGTDQILRGALAGGKKEVLFESAAVYDICGPVMIYRDYTDEKFYLDDLQGRKAALPAETLSTHLLLEDTLYLFGYEGDQRNCYKVDLSSLAVTTHPVRKPILWVEADENSFYYTYTAKSETVLMHYDRATGREQEIYRDEKGVGFDFNEDWFIYWSGNYVNNPYLYDRATGATRRVYDDPYGNTQRLYGNLIFREVTLGDGIVRLAAYDLAADVEVPMEDLGFSDRFYDFYFSEDLYIYYESDLLESVTVYINGEARKVAVDRRFKKREALTVKANEKGIAFITDEEFLVATWETPRLRAYTHGE